jgi:hypothetical protein
LSQGKEQQHASFKSSSFETADEVAKMGRLNSEYKAHLARPGLKGVARVFYLAQPRMKADDIYFEEFQVAFVN